MKKQNADVIVIGGGAAGMLCAATAAENGARVLLIEKNEYTGKKLRITGKGRCNVTNNCSVRQVLENISTNNRFLYSALNQFSPEDTMAFFERLGVPLKTERGNRVFPQSDKAADVVSALRIYMKQTGVQILHDTVTEIETENQSVCAVKTEKDAISCRAAVLCTGGVSYPATGSDGDGYVIAKALGHHIVQPRPSLVPLESDNDFCSSLQGLALKNVGMSVYNCTGKQIYKDFGEMLFTHFGLSGPIILSASAHMCNYEKEHYRISVDLKPALDEKKLDLRILRDFEKYANRDLQNALVDLLHKRMIPIIIQRAGLFSEKKVNSITKDERARLLQTLKNFEIPISGPRPIDEAIITAGGIDVREVSPSTMESKKIRGLYFAGEILDVDAYTGGFNLQIAWSTAYVAGTHVSYDIH